MGKGPTELKGKYIVHPTASAISCAWTLCSRKMRPYQILKRHASKLMHWPTGADDKGAFGCDIDWDWIKSLESLQIGELRIDEDINGHDNVRVIFFKANRPLAHEALCRIWLMTVFQKKRNDFTSVQLSSFRSMRSLIVKRYYDNEAAS